MTTALTSTFSDLFDPVRVFGSVPWDYVVASVCITLTAVILAGTLSLMLSMIYRHAYTVILVTILGYLPGFGMDWHASSAVCCTPIETQHFLILFLDKQ